MIASRDDFWDLIATASEFADFYYIHDWIIDNLSDQNDEDMRRFEMIFSELMNESYRWNLWGAAFVINGGCSDDGFEYFRAWLIAMGKTVFENALKNPDSLAEVLAEEWNGEEVYEYEEFMSIPINAYMLKHKIEEYDYDADPLKSEIIPPNEILGEEWEEENLPQIVPKLCKMVKWDSE